MPFHRAEPMPPEAVDTLFSALTMRYGTPFLDRWRDIDLGAVKDDWARELANFKPFAIRFALEHLPEKPPTVIDFRKIANQAPPPMQHNALRYANDGTRGPTPAEREAMRELSRRIKAGGVYAQPGRRWAAELLRDHDTGWRGDQAFSATPTAVAMARDALREPITNLEEPTA